MLQLTFGLPFWQCPVPSAVSLTVVNAAPVTACADAAENNPTAAMHTSTAKPRNEYRAREELRPDRARGLNTIPPSLELTLGSLIHESSMVRAPSRLRSRYRTTSGG